MAEISSMAMPLFLFFQARTAHSTSLLADFSLSGVEKTTRTASWLEITSHTYEKQEEKHFKIVQILICSQKTLEML